MLIGTLSRNFEALRDKWDASLPALPELGPAHVLLHSVKEWREDEVEEKLAAYVDRWQGWIRRQSAVGLCPNHGLTPEKAGLPLAGEWVSTDNPLLSARLSFSSGRWRLVEIEEVAAGTEGAIVCLRQEDESTCPLAQKAGSEIARLNYAVYWGASKNDPAATRRLFARFTGFIQP